MELIQLLLTLIAKVPFLSEAEHENALDLLRAVAANMGHPDAVPPRPVDANQPAPPPPVVEVPGPVAEPVPADEQAPPPVSPEVQTPESAVADPNAMPPAG